MNILVANLGLDQLQVPLVRHARRAAACPRRHRADRGSGEPLDRRDLAANARDGSRQPAITQRPCGLSRAVDRSERSVALKMLAKWRRSASRRCMAARSAACSESRPQVLAAMEEDEPSGPGPQSAVCCRDAAAERKAAGNSARGGLRDRLSLRRFPIGCGTTPFRTNGPIGLRIQRWGFHGASHRYIAERTAQLTGSERSAADFLPPRRIEFAVRDSRRTERRDQHGHEPAIGLAAEQSRRRFRSVRIAAHHASTPANRSTKCSRRWPSEAACWA